MPEASFLTPRTAPRFSFVAEAEVMGQSGGGMHMVARISELSARGCYVDTVNPFPVDAKVHLLIRFGCSVCELTGKVLYTHTGYGMGVLFEEVAPQHRATLEAWLVEIARKSA